METLFITYQAKTLERDVHQACSGSNKSLLHTAHWQQQCVSNRALSKPVQNNEQTDKSTNYRRVKQKPLRGVERET